MKKLITSAQAAEKLGFSADYVRRLCSEGKIKATKYGKTWCMTERDIKDIKRQRTRAKDEQHGINE